MLADILRGDARSVLVQDSVSICGRCLLHAYVHSLVRRDYTVHVFALSVPPSSWSALFPNQVVVHDVYSDPLGWTARQGLASNTSSLTLDSLNAGTVLECIRGCTKKSDKDCKVKSFTNQGHGSGNAQTDTPLTLQTESLSLKEDQDLRKVAIVFDSLSSLISAQPLGKVYQLLLELGMEVFLCSLLHADLHSSHVLSSLEYVCPTVVKLSIGTKPGAQGQAHVRHVRKSGKVLKSIEWFKISDDFSLTAEPVAPTVSTQQADESGPDPTANLPFNLTLSEKEKEDRSKTSLPYLKTEEQKVQLLSTGSGKIFYTPDEADDFDDSDPDDDLDV